MRHTVYKTGSKRRNDLASPGNLCQQQWLPPVRWCAAKRKEIPIKLLLVTTAFSLLVWNHFRMKSFTITISLNVCIFFQMQVVCMEHVGTGRASCWG